MIPCIWSHVSVHPTSVVKKQRLLMIKTSWYALASTSVLLARHINVKPFGKLKWAPANNVTSPIFCFKKVASRQVTLDNAVTSTKVNLQNQVQGMVNPNASPGTDSVSHI
ncbi:hypothetical protein PGT21_007876 [Puccinia graminis f. sp. tritici]|uniref:Uncharacterized protein n=1 Tax=Puccinia graminis f. sp. tritici TaxID=56615 RepID=A0A5B0LH42_PUCGR|nr:hypothetical protein PGTUg99_006419 [Puccinia graminis f. sp. tritici]KAA1065695.1 hypothetical protein PGT21_007876 [Puccinia graminis f. sp. tritici]